MGMSFEPQYSQKDNSSGRLLWGKVRDRKEQADSLPVEPPEKPKNTGGGSLSLLQGIFPNWESKWGRLHCKRIVHQLSSQGFPTTYNGYSYAYIKASLIL